ncbi:tetratricopeptide repeat protein [Streptomyces sp. NPDC097619]|uniref:tetratricopeptide repeat protein n=1 Tax=Streptomyces sp. NPDC097619 TaxID=3157228 RepID=UPI003324C41A
MTLRDLAAEMRVGRSQLSVYLGGSVPRADFVEALVRATVAESLRERRQAEVALLLFQAQHPPRPAARTAPAKPELPAPRPAGDEPRSDPYTGPEQRLRETWPKAAEWDALAAGAHRARPNARGEAVPPYVQRDVDVELRRRVTAAAEHGGLVLVVGESTAGKTRALYQALRAALPHYRVLAPAKGAVLLPTVESACRSTECVLWLDDLDAYLGPDGLTPTLLGHLTHARVPVLATIRTQQYEAFRSPLLMPGGREDHISTHRTVATGAQILRQLDFLRLHRLWSEEELERAQASDDPRIVDALRHHGPHGIAEYLAAGPALLDEWEAAAHGGGHPSGALLVSLAVDLRRAGRNACPDKVLRRLHRERLAVADPLIRPEPVEEAWRWATQVRYGATSMLLPTMDPTSWNVFDYLVDHTRTRIAPDVWQAALECSTNEERFRVGYSAFFRGVPQVAKEALAPLAEEAHSDAANLLGVLLLEERRPEEAQALWRRAADAGHPGAAHNLGGILHFEGHGDEARHYWRMAAAAGVSDSAFHLGTLLMNDEQEEEGEAFWRQAAGAGHIDAAHALASHAHRTGRLDEARVYWRQAADGGSLESAFTLGTMLKAEGRPEEAEIYLRRAADAHHADAANILGALLCRSGRNDEAMAYYRQAADTSHTPASYNLACLLRSSGHLAEAEPYFRQAADAGHREAAYSLGNELTTLGRTDEAETYLRRAAHAGHTSAAYNLANLLFRAGRHDEAERYYRDASEAGHIEAANNLGVLLLETGRPEEAEAHWVRHIDPSDPDIPLNLASHLMASGRREEAEALLRRTADLGHLRAVTRLGGLMEATGRFEDAVDLWRRAADSGDPEAAYVLGNVLRTKGRKAQAETYYRIAAKSGLKEPLTNLAGLLIERGRHEEAEKHLRLAIDAGDTTFAPSNLALLLRRTGREEEAQHYFRMAAEGLAGKPRGDGTAQ